MINVRVHDSRAVGVGADLDWDVINDDLFASSLALPAGLRRVYKTSTLSMVSAFFFILLDRSAHSVSLLQGPAKHIETNEGTPTWTAKPSSFLSVLVEGEPAINPSQILLLLVHLSRIESLCPQKSRQAVGSKKNNALEVNLWVLPVLFAGSTSGASEEKGFCVPCALFHRSRGQDVGQLITKPITNWNWFISQVVLKEGTAWWLDMAEQTGLTWNFWTRQVKICSF